MMISIITVKLVTSNNLYY